MTRTVENLAALLDLYAEHLGTDRVVYVSQRAAEFYGPTLITRLCRQRGLSWAVP